MYPRNVKRNNRFICQTHRTPEFAEKFEARTYYAGVGLAHGEDYTLPLSKETPVAINYQGLQEITLHE